MQSFKAGDRVLYSGGWGARPPVPGTVTGHGEKNGSAVLDVTLDNGDTHWGYLDQFAPLDPPSPLPFQRARAVALPCRHEHAEVGRGCFDFCPDCGAVRSGGAPGAAPGPWHSCEGCRL